jgi:hypothetical protein
MPVKNSTIDSLREKGWAFPTSQEHTLGNLQGKRLGGSYRLMPVIGPENHFGAAYFHVFLRNTRGETNQQPIITGLHNQGSYPSYNWIEVINYSSRASFGAGDVTDVPEKQIVVAAGEGAKAALQAHRYLQRLAN